MSYTEIVPGNFCKVDTLHRLGDLLQTPIRKAYYKGRSVSFPTAFSCEVKENAPASKMAQVAWKILAIATYPLALIGSFLKTITPPTLKQIYPNMENTGYAALQQQIESLKNSGFSGKLSLIYYKTQKASQNAPNARDEGVNLVMNVGILTETYLRIRRVKNTEETCTFQISGNFRIFANEDN